MAGNSHFAPRRLGIAARLKPEQKLALVGAVGRSLPPVAAGLGALYLVLALSHFLTLASPLRWAVAGTEAAVGVLLFGTSAALQRWPAAARLVHPLAAAIAGSAALNGLYYLGLSDDVHHTTTLLLIAIGAGFFVLDGAWLAVVLTGMLAGWSAIAWTAGFTREWQQFGFALGFSAALSAVVHALRVREVLRVEALRERELQRRFELEAIQASARQSSASLQALLESASDGIVLVRDSGCIESVNARIESMFGYERDELIGQPVALLVPARFRLDHGRHCAGFFQDPRVRPMGAGLDLVARRRDGTEFPVDISLSYIRADGVLRVMGFVVDITHRRQAEKVLKDYSERLEEMVYERTRDLEEAQIQILAQERLQDDLLLAEQVQASLLPRELPTLTGFDFAATALPARYVSGDVYDLILTGSETCHIVVADIAGKGVPAALLTLTARTLIRAETEHESSPAAILSSVNRSLYDDLSDAGAFMTVFMARLDARLGVLTCANAGHTETLHRRSDAGLTERIAGTGLPVGIFPDAACYERQVLLLPGDVLVFYSDGITEAESPAGEFFGIDRLAALLALHASGAASEIAGAIITAAEAFRGGGPRGDDLTVIVVKCQPRSVQFAYPASLDALGEMLRLVGQVCTPYGPGLAYELELATSELATNIITHGYRGAPGEIRGRLSLAPDQVRLDLYDDGSSFDPSQVPAAALGSAAEGGYGLHIVRQIADELAYEPATPAGNHWHLARRAAGRGQGQRSWQGGG